MFKGAKTHKYWQGFIQALNSSKTIVWCAFEYYPQIDALLDKPKNGQKLADWARAAARSAKSFFKGRYWLWQ